MLMALYADSYILPGLATHNGNEGAAYVRQQIAKLVR